MEAVSIFLNHLSPFKYFLLFPGLVFEGPILTFISAFMSSPAGGSVFNITIVFILVLLADVVGDIMYYSIGRWGGANMIKKFGTRMGVTDARIEYVKEYYRKHGKKTLAVAKISHGLGWPTMMIAGAIRVPFAPFLMFTTIVSILKSVLFVAIGYYYGESYTLLSDYISLGGFIITTIVIVVIIAIIVSILKRKK